MKAYEQAHGVRILDYLDLHYYPQATGVALTSAGKFTVGDIRILGLCEIALGLTAGLLPGFGLWFWIAGFGLLHIVYGILMYAKYEK